MEQVFLNVDVLCEILKFLNLEELINLTNVCTQFRTVIVDFVWKNKYKHIEVCKIAQHFGMLLTNNAVEINEEKEIGFEISKQDKAILSKKSVESFLQLIANNVRRLVLYSPAIYFKRDENSLIFNPTEFGVRFNDSRRQTFVNLTAITFHHLVITERDLRLLNEGSGQLKKLRLDNCFNINERTLVIGDDIKMTTLQNMKGLKCFEISVYDVADKDLSYDLSKILSMLRMMVFIIKIRNFAIIDEDDNEADTIPETLSSTTTRCEELTIGYFRSQRIFRKFNNSILINFKSLKKLVMESWALISVNEDFFKKLNKTLSQLEYLKLQNFEVNGFAPVDSLKVLVLENCTALIWRDFQIMLSDMNLNTFSILDTEYIGIFEYFNVSTTLEHLLVINCQRNHFRKLFDINNGHNLRNLTSLIWHDNYAQVPIYVATNCAQLKILVAEPSSLLINNLYSLTRLEKLTLRVGRKIKFSKIIIILKHSNLKHFTLTKLENSFVGYEEHSDYLIDYDLYDNELLEFEDRRINCTFVNISLNSYFKIAQDFWFNLLNNNPKLMLMIRYNRCLHHDHLFLKFIINHRKFPKRIKSIKICGYRIDIMEFRNNFATTIEKMKSFSNLYKDNEDRGYLLL